MGSSESFIRVLLVDDQALVRSAIGSKLERESFFQVETAWNADDALGKCANFKPDVVLMDIDMPGLNSFDAARQIKSNHVNNRVIFLSAYVQDALVEQAIEVDADGYVTKGSDFDDLVECIRKVASGERWFSKEIASRLVEDARGGRGAHRPKTRLATLTPREQAVLGYIAKGHSKKEIATLMHISVKTVDSHTVRLMNKLQIHDRVELTRFAIREGLVQA
jgi:DNA-binding NarL/FixJ family response regulator